MAAGEDIGRVGADSLAAVLHLQQRALAATDVATLGFTIVNETLQLVGYRQAALFVRGELRTWQLQAASGLASVAEDSPFAVWLAGFVAALPTPEACTPLDVADAAPGQAEGWQEWLPEHLLLAPLPGPDGAPAGLVLYARETPWSEAEADLLARLHQAYGYCLQALRGRPGRWRTLLAGAAGRKRLAWTAAAVLACLCIPVRLSALAPAEVVALSAVAVAAPQEGVVSAFHVAPNAPVKAGDRLFSLDDGALASRREVARGALNVARAELLSAQQRAFDDTRSKGELAAAMGRVREKEAELALAEQSLQRVTVKAEHDGVAIFGDPNDWLGRPVQTGERVMQLADPRQAGVLVWLPVTDALNLEAGAPLRLFLHVKPLDPLSGQLLETSYQAVPGPDGVASYRLRGSFGADAGQPRIGLRGTARVAGGWSLLGYFLLRRPIASVREWTGL